MNRIKLLLFLLILYSTTFSLLAETFGIDREMSVGNFGAYSIQCLRDGVTPDSLHIISLSFGKLSEFYDNEIFNQL